LLRADDVARALAADVLRLPLVGAKRDPIAGDVTQYDLASVLPRALQTQWHAVMRAAATTVGISDASELSIQAEKLLSAAPGKGEQALHFDRDDEADRLRRVFSCILYCSHGAHSTAVPRFAPGDFALPVYDDSEAVLNATELRATVERGLWEDEAYHQCNVAPGDVMIFSQAVPHRGTRNPLALAPRICLFSIVTPFAEPKQDDFQVYRWMYIAAAYGFASRELAAAVHRDRAHRPLDRFSADAKGAEAREAYVTNLLRWSCIAYHPDTRRVEWLQDVGVEPQSEEAVLVAYTGRSASVRARAVKRSSGKM
ncbi:MAG: hypothetical protein Q7T57_04675, partial [Dehalococcoidales bacterium]|nr:hypothetical protein [Dehalococcoidales bacterium]